MDVVLANQHFQLHKSGAMYWFEENALLIADLHAGKAAHFRKNGIPITSDYLLQDLNLLEALIKKYHAAKVYFLGDLFHSFSNVEHQVVEDWMKNMSVSFVLIEGNHDQYSHIPDFCTVHNHLKIKDIVLRHEMQTKDAFSIFGHLHPGIKIKGKGRLYTSLPAFYVNPKYIAMPAFGSLKGCRMYTDLVIGSAVYALTPETLIAL